MKLRNNIGWCDATGNMVIGCTEAGPECLRCYAKYETPARVLRAGAWPGRHGQAVETWGPLGERVPVGTLEKLLPWASRRCLCDRCQTVHPWAHLTAPDRGGVCADPACRGPLRRIRVFGDSSSDWLDKQWPLERRAMLLRLAFGHPNVDLLLLTKRSGAFGERVGEVADWERRHGEPLQADLLNSWMRKELVPTNLWLGVSIGVRASLPRLDELRAIPAAVRFVSFEPLLEDVTEVGSGKSEVGLDLSGIQWAIFGGESGSLGAKEPRRRPRPCQVRWIRNGVRAGHAAGVKCYVKQMGSLCVDRNDAGFEGDKEDGWPMDTDTVDDVEPGTYQGKPVRVKLRHPDGADPAEWPEALRRREFQVGR